MCRGDRLAGDTYNLIGRAVDHRHNQVLPHIVDEYGPVPHSVCYVVREGSRFVTADSDSTDKSEKIKAARASGELMSLSRAAIDADVAFFLRDLESMSRHTTPTCLFPCARKNPE